MDTDPFGIEGLRDESLLRLVRLDVAVGAESGQQDLVVGHVGTHRDHFSFLADSLHTAGQQHVYVRLDTVALVFDHLVHVMPALQAILVPVQLVKSRRPLPLQNERVLKGIGGYLLVDSVPGDPLTLVLDCNKDDLAAFRSKLETRFILPSVEVKVGVFNDSVIDYNRLTMFSHSYIPDGSAVCIRPQQKATAVA